MDNVDYYEYNAEDGGDQPYYDATGENTGDENNYVLSDGNPSQTPQQIMINLDDALYESGMKSEKLSAKVSFHRNNPNSLMQSSLMSLKSGASFNLQHSPMQRPAPSSFSEKKVSIKLTNKNSPSHNMNGASGHNLLERKSSNNSLRSSFSVLTKSSHVVDNSLKPTTPLKKTKSGFQLLKDDAKMLRKAVDPVSGDLWSEWQAANSGPVFYAKEIGTGDGNTAAMNDGTSGPFHHQHFRLFLHSC